MISTSELDSELMTVGMPCPNEGVYGEDRIEQSGHRRERARWIDDYVREAHNLSAPHDVHLLNADPSEATEAQNQADRVRQHWGQLVGTVATGSEMISRDRPAFYWQYSPFEYEDLRVTELGQQPEERAGPMPVEKMERIINLLSRRCSTRSPWRSMLGVISGRLLSLRQKVIPIIIVLMIMIGTWTMI